MCTYFASFRWQLLSQSFQFLLFNQQLLVVSFSEGLKGKNPLKETQEAVHTLANNNSEMTDI